jgi:hypothetical protein
MSPEEPWVEGDCHSKLLDAGLKITSFGEKLPKIASNLSVVWIDP